MGFGSIQEGLREPEGTWIRCKSHGGSRVEVPNSMDSDHLLCDVSGFMFNNLLRYQ